MFFFTLEEMLMAVEGIFQNLTVGINKELERYKASDDPVQRDEAAQILDEFHKSLVDFSYNVKGLRASFLDIDEKVDNITTTDLQESVLGDLAKLNDVGYRPEV